MSSSRSKAKTRGARASVFRMAFAATALLLPAACQLIADLGRPQDGPLDIRDASADVPSPADTADAADAELPHECRPVFDERPPPANPKEVDPFGLAFSFMTFVPGSGDAGDLCPTAGLALDDKQTGLVAPQPDGSTACPTGVDAACAPSCNNPVVLTPIAIQDYAGGVDNGFLRLRTVLLAGADLGRVSRSLDPTPAFLSGKANLILKVAGYNGEADDDDVGVGVFESPGLEGGETSWDGVTPLVWKVVSPERKTRGFVRGAVLFVEIPDPFVMPFFSDATTPDQRPVRAHIAFARLTGKLARLPSGDYAITSGLLGLAFQTQELLRLVAHVPGTLFVADAGPNQRACNLPTVHPKDLLCGFADLSSTPGGDCDRLSVGVLFRAGPANVGTSVDAVNDPETCADAGGYDPNADCDFVLAGRDR